MSGLASPHVSSARASGEAPAASPRDPQKQLEQALKAWGGNDDLWVFGYASLIWRPEFEFAESRLARVRGWHRALKMWSRVNRGTPEVPGLVFALLSGGSCRGVAYRVPREQASEVLARMWLREMVTDVYDPRWLPCETTTGPVRALGFTLSRNSPSYTGPMDSHQYRTVFERASGRYGSTIDYVQATGRTLDDHGIRDRTLHRLLRDYGAIDASRSAGPGPSCAGGAASDSARSAASPWSAAPSDSTDAT
ncbi:MAG: gamma-glutamylcyclotransferase [Burkholderiales bacterium]